MVTEYLRYEIDAHRQTKFIDDYAVAAKALLKSPYAVSFEFYQCVEDPAQFIIRIEWTSADDHLQRFRSSAEFKDFFASVRAYVGDISEMRHYRQLVP